MQESVSRIQAALGNGGTSCNADSRLPAASGSPGLEEAPRELALTDDGQESPGPDLAVTGDDDGADNGVTPILFTFPLPKMAVGHGSPRPGAVGRGRLGCLSGCERKVKSVGVTP